MSKIRKQKTRFPRAVHDRNRLNDLDSRRWLQFQKSWFVVSEAKSQTAVATEFILFFTKELNAAGQRSRLGILEENLAAIAPVAKKLRREVVAFDAATGAARSHDQAQKLDYVLIDLQDENAFQKNFAAWLQRVYSVAHHLKPNAYLTIFVRNSAASRYVLPWAWQWGLAVSEFLTIKDERIGCLSDSKKLNLIGPDGKLAHAAIKETKNVARANLRTRAGWKTRQDVVYCLNFRREEIPGENSAHDVFPLSKIFSLTPFHQAPVSSQLKSAPATRHAPATLPPSWFVAKPPPREKNVLLHPAKFPESLVTYFLHEFSRPGERVFDPMAGTGSTLLAALAAGRQAYGIELNSQFHGIAKARLEKYLAENPESPREPWRLQCGDAARAGSYRGLPATFDYVLTSPPYWDMLRMKGAETQQKRKQAGLLQFYSDDARDLGNRSDYEKFLSDLVRIYLRVAERLAAGHYMTIIVKNIKKRGKIYPLAWHLAQQLSTQLILCDEQFWCQDDQRLAPFGYLYAWVSNTFHHYCLHFRKP